MKIIRRPLRHQLRIFLLALLTAVPATGTALVLLWMGDFSTGLRWGLTGLLAAAALLLAGRVRAHVDRPLQTLSN
ncbi:MAG TPA: hypothetical protein VEQ60_05950, partial [Longimicrobium sp.]|nr:hypothetical protein [Longimicrobium sp.]